MLRTIALPAVTVAFAAAALAAQEPAPGPAGPTPSASPAMTLTGCLSRSGDGKGFVLTGRALAPGPLTSATTSSAAATSATGDGPGGSVTGDTPTGTTAVGTAVPTPPVGEPGKSVNPASPTYNQGAASAGTSGTVGRADTTGAATASASYRLRPAKGVDLAAHVGHTVEVHGTLEHDPRAQGAGPASGVTASGTHARADTPELTVQSLIHRADTCQR